MGLWKTGDNGDDDDHDDDDDLFGSYIGTVVSPDS